MEYYVCWFVYIHLFWYVPKAHIWAVVMPSSKSFETTRDKCVFTTSVWNSYDYLSILHYHYAIL